MKNLIFILAFMPFAGLAQIEPTLSIQFGGNSGSGLHTGLEAGISIDRRVTAAIDYNFYWGNYNENSFGAKLGLATIYKDSDGLCPVYLIVGTSFSKYQVNGKPMQSITPTYAVRVQTYNAYWEVGRQNGYWFLTVAYQFRKIYD